MLSVVIPVYNKWSLTEQCLRVLAKTGCEDLEVIVVDNASSDETPAAAPALGDALFPGHFIFLREQCNRNFAGAINDGARRAGGSFLLWLNNDTIPLDNWREPLLAALSGNPSFGAVGPLLLYPPKNGKLCVQHAGIVFSLNRQVSHLYEYFPATHRLVTKERRLQAITGAAFCLPRELFLSLGGLDERFINGFEDVEFCDRLCRAGFVQAVVPSSRIIHIGQQTEGRGDHELENSRLCGELCKSLRFDKARVWREDGYSVSVSPWLRKGAPVFLPMLPQYGAERNAALASDSLSPLRTLFEFDPFWVEGGLALADRLERAGQYRDALDQYILLTDFCQTPDVLLPFAAFLQRHDPSMLRGLAKSISAFATDPAARRTALYMAEKKLALAGEKDLAWQVGKLQAKNTEFFARTYPRLRTFLEGLSRDS